jgi:hypothetical protein
MSDDPSDLDLYKSAHDARVNVAGRRAGLPLLVGAAAVLVLALVGAYMYLRAPSRKAAPPAAAAPVDRPPAARAAEPAELIALPPLDETDDVVREMIGRLSSHPTVAAWLTTDGLILNFTVVALRISNGESPAQELRAVGPIPAFNPRISRDDLFVAPSSYQRYNRYAEAVSALDARGAARLYATLKPRVNDAYRRMGPPTGDFDPVLERAIVELLRVPVVHGEIELAPQGIVYGFVDPRLERLSAAQKHLLRMGPQNVQAIQAKLRDIADYLAIPASRLR